MTGPLLTTYIPEEYQSAKHDVTFAMMTNNADTIKGVTDQLKYKPDLIKIWYIVPDIGLFTEQAETENLVARFHA